MNRAQRQIKRARAILGSAMKRTPKHRPEDEFFTGKPRPEQHIVAVIRGASEDMYIQASIDRFKGSNLTPKQLQKMLQEKIVEPYEEWHIQDQKIRQQRREEAEKKATFQKSPFYIINLGATFGIFGSYYGSRGRSPEGLKYAEDLRKMDNATIQEAIKRLREGDIHGYPLETYSSDYIEKTINFLIAELQTRN